MARVLASTAGGAGGEAAAVIRDQAPVIRFPVGNETNTLMAMVTTHGARTQTKRWMKPFYFLLGLGAVAVGIVGIFLPLIPTTGPLLIAAFAFGRSSDRLHDWLMNHPRLGPLIKDFRDDRSIPRNTKIVAVISMTAAFTYSTGWVVPGPYLKTLVAAIGLWAIWYVVHLPTARLSLPSEA